MNKELILKYQNEFNHWLKNPKNLLIKIKDENWRTFDEAGDDWTWTDHYTDNILIVINDKYSIFRKAGAEGKQLQVSYNNGKTWYDKQYKKISWYDSQLVRIKPEYTKEPEIVIVIGDFVRVAPHNHQNKNTYIKRVKSITTSGSDVLAYVFDDESCAYPKYVKLWKPTEKDLCWHRVSGWSRKEESILRYWSKESDVYDFVEPYIEGKLPSWMKGEIQ